MRGERVRETTLGVNQRYLFIWFKVVGHWKELHVVSGDHRCESLHSGGSVCQPLAVDLLTVWHTDKSAYVV